MWTETNRVKYERSGLCYASDLTDAAFALIEPHIPAPRRHGRPRTTELHRVVSAIFYLLSSGCQWWMSPRDFPPKSTVYDYFLDWREDGTWQGLHNALYRRARDLARREASPSAGVIDSQSVKSTESGGIRGFDAGKKVMGRKRHIVVDTLGLLLVAGVHAGSVQDRDGAVQVFRAMGRLFPWLETVFADGAYSDAKLHAALKPLGGWPLQIVNDPIKPTASK